MEKHKPLICSECNKPLEKLSITFTKTWIINNVEKLAKEGRKFCSEKCLIDFLGK
jgi:endogenous inhibitor of DNA gyrase (YacG/DUF329 family)